jgi:type I restriction enzyme M protein
MAVTQQEIENRLWDAADELRVAMPEAQYASVVFPLMFWKYLSDTWEHQHQEFLTENQDENLSAEEAHEIEYRDYQSFEIPLIHSGTVAARRASWASILATITQPGLGQRVRASLQAIETANPDKFSRLFGSMTWTSEEVLPREVLAAVMQAMDRTPKMHEGNMSHDVLGGAYEYLLKRFSDGSGTRAGQFFTPREVVELLVELLDPKSHESVYDPTCGSGGMLIASANLLKTRGGRGYTLKLYGQEAVPDTAGVARMNLFMHNLTQFKVEVGDTLKDPRFTNPDGSVKRFDVILANPPYSLKWKPWTDDPRAMGGVAPQSSADWAFVQHMIASMQSRVGRAGVVLPHGVLFHSGQEAAIRKSVLDDDLLEAVIGLPEKLFYNTPIETCILVFRAPGAKAPERRGGVLFIDASQRFSKGRKRNTLSETDIADTVTAYRSKFDSEGYPVDLSGDDLIARFVSLDEIKCKENDYDLSISRYIKQATGESQDLGKLIEEYRLVRSERQETEQLMLHSSQPLGSKAFLSKVQRLDTSAVNDGWPQVALGGVISQQRNAVKVSGGQEYRLLGVRWWGEGAFHRETVTQETSKATTFYKVEQGQFIYNRLFAGKGSFATVDPELKDAYVSNEFPLFETNAEELRVDYLKLYFQQRSVWDYVEAVSTGTTKSRNRWKEEQFLAHRIPLPPLHVQENIVRSVEVIDAQVSALEKEAEALRAVRGALLSGLLDRTIEIESAGREE